MIKGGLGPQTPAYSGLPKLLVFGGNGFVGTRVCEEALNTGLAVVSVNRSGPPKGAPAWAAQVQWVQVLLYSSRLGNDNMDMQKGAKALNSLNILSNHFIGRKYKKCALACAI